MIFLSRLYEGLVRPAAADDAYRRHALGVQPLHLSAGELDYGLSDVVGDEDAVDSAGAGELATGPGTRLDVADRYALGDLRQG